MNSPTLTGLNFKRLCKTTFLMLLVAASLLASFPLQAADKTPSDKLLPPNVYAYASFPSVAEMKKHFKVSAGQEILDDAAFVDFKKEVEKLIVEFSAKVQKKLGVSLEELAEIPSGEIAFAFLQTSEANPALVALIDFGDSKETVDKLMAKAIKSIGEKDNIKSSSEDVDGTKIQIYTKVNEEDDDEEDDDSGKLKDQFAYFVKGSHLVVGSSPEVLKDILARWDGKHEETFSENEVYQHILKRCQTEGRLSHLKWYLDPLGATKNAMTASGQMNQSFQMGMAMLPIFGVNNLKAIGGSIDDGGEKYESMSRMMAYIDLPADGLLKVFECTPTSLSPPKWVKSNVVAYMSFNWNISGAIDAIREMTDNFQGPGTFDKIINKIAEEERGPKIHLIKDFTDHLDGKIHYVFYPPKKMEEVNIEAIATQSPNFLLALDLKNSDKIKTALAKLMKTPGNPGETRQFKGETIYEFPMPTPPGVNREKQKAAICVTNDSLMMTTNVKGLEAIIRGNDDQQALVDSDDYKRIAAAFPEKTSILSFQKQEPQLKIYWKLLKSGKVQESLKQTPLKDLDFTKLPPFESVKKYLVQQGAFVIPDENGFVMTAFAVRKK